jgi:predicted unusual protein kinase regulating ubiquinone biosynthesis (AarF/ABC1/UbiB family)
MADTIPTGTLSRGKVLGKALLKIGAQKSKQVLTQQNKQETHEIIADIIMEALGELKGVSVKIAQQIALGMPFLPPAYQEKISKSFNAIPGINKALVRKIIKTELGRYPHEVFDHFEMEAFAAASLGQVHKAIYQGKPLAVKIQYPGIKKSIQTDMKLIHFALKRFAKGHNVDHIVDEIAQRLYEEVDYTLEAENYRFFQTNLHNPNLIVPNVYPEFSSGKVLTCDYLEGMDLDRYLATNPTQEEKNAYAQMIFENFFETLYRLKRVHADPNPGNFLFMQEGKLGLIDFGCIKQIDDTFLARYNALHLDLLNNADDEVLVEHYRTFGMIPEDTPTQMLHFYREVIKPLDRLYIEPLAGTHYDFGKHNDFSKRGFEAIFEVQQKQYHAVHQVNKHYLFLDRTLLGYYALFEKMGAKIETKNVKKRMKEYAQ